MPLVDLVYPPRCPACGVATVSQGGLCLECWSGIEFPPIVETKLNGGGSVLLEPDVIAATYYNDVSRRLVLAYKHGGKITLAKLLGQMISSRMPPRDIGAPPLIIPVPLHRSRILHRGFNQAALLAKELARRCHGEILVDGLRRTKRTPSLGGLDKEERRAALNGAICVSKRATKRINGRNIILVDDVYTSGATSNACASALQMSGAKSVRVACFAIAIDH